MSDLKPRDVVKSCRDIPHVYQCGIVPGRDELCACGCTGFDEWCFRVYLDRQNSLLAEAQEALQRSLKSFEHIREMSVPNLSAHCMMAEEGICAILTKLDAALGEKK